MEKITALLTALVELFSLNGRMKGVFDKSAWLLMAPALAAVYAVDQELAMTLLKWTLFALVLSGASVVVSRVVFPQISLTDLVESAQNDKNLAAGIISASIVFFVGIIFFGLVVWAKA